MRYILLILVTLSLSGCGTALMRDLSQGFKNFGEDTSASAKPAPAPASYCYSTLGVVNCYDKPLPKDEDSKFMGSTAVPIVIQNKDGIMKGDAVSEQELTVPVELEAPKFEIQTPAEPVPPPPVAKPSAESKAEKPKSTKTQSKRNQKSAPSTKKEVKSKPAQEQKATVPVMPPTKQEAEKAKEGNPKLDVPKESKIDQPIEPVKPSKPVTNAIELNDSQSDETPSGKQEQPMDIKKK